jgi:hypothetical protein
MSLQALARAFEAGECRLRKDGLAHRGDELAQHSPTAGSGQAAAERGEFSSAPISGSSKRSISR